MKRCCMYYIIYQSERKGDWDGMGVKIKSIQSGEERKGRQEKEKERESERREEQEVVSTIT